MSDVSQQATAAGPINTEEFYRQEFTVFNPAGTVGVSCNGRGLVSALMLEPEALTDDEVLAEEIVAIARLARAKYRMELRLFSLRSIEAQGLNPDRMDRFYRGVQKLPTPEEFDDMQAAEFAKRYPQ